MHADRNRERIPGSLLERERAVTRLVRKGHRHFSPGETASHLLCPGMPLCAARIGGDIDTDISRSPGRTPSSRLISRRQGRRISGRLRAGKGFKSEYALVGSPRWLRGHRSRDLNTVESLPQNEKVHRERFSSRAETDCLVLGVFAL